MDPENIMGFVEAAALFDRRGVGEIRREIRADSRLNG